MLSVHGRFCFSRGAGRTTVQIGRRLPRSIFAEFSAGVVVGPSTTAAADAQQIEATNIAKDGQSQLGTSQEYSSKYRFYRHNHLQQCSSGDNNELPKEIRARLDTLKTDVLEALMDDHHLEEEAGGGLSLLMGADDHSLQFTRNFQEMAKYYFSQGGKLIRPTISLLMSAACNRASPSSTSRQEVEDEEDQEQISLNQYRIAMVAEMIHNATLIHDDVIDESDTRRGLPTASAIWGNKQAVLVGDYILARATKVLCTIGQPKVIKTMANIVEDLVKGELMQLNTPLDNSGSDRFQHYMVKTFYKTGSLFANSCKSVAMLSGCNETAQYLATEFGRNLGLAFQIIDDVLDYVSSTAELGKPTASDLRLGLATCPVLFAAKEHPELDTLIERRFSEAGDIELALEMVHKSNGLNSSRELARQHGEAAIKNVTQMLPDGGKVRDCLIDIVIRQLDRER